MLDQRDSHCFVYGTRYAFTSFLILYVAAAYNKWGLDVEIVSTCVVLFILHEISAIILLGMVISDSRNKGQVKIEILDKARERIKAKYGEEEQPKTTGLEQDFSGSRTMDNLDPNGGDNSPAHKSGAQVHLKDNCLFELISEHHNTVDLRVSDKKSS